MGKGHPLGGRIYDGKRSNVRRSENTIGLARLTIINKFVG